MHPYYYVQYVPISLKQDPLVSEQKLTVCIRESLHVQSLCLPSLLFLLHVVRLSFEGSLKSYETVRVGTCPLPLNRQGLVVLKLDLSTVLS